MEKYDSQQLMTAIEYVKRMANGNNPVNNSPLPDNDVLNNPNIIRCMFFVRDVLQGVLLNGGMVGKATNKLKRQLPEECLSRFTYNQDQGINKFIDQLYKHAGKEYKKVSGQVIQAQLLAAGYLTVEYNNEVEKEIKVPTEKGKSIGLRLERVEYSSPQFPYVYYQIIYNKEAQEFLVQNWTKFLNGEVIE